MENTTPTLDTSNTSPAVPPATGSSPVSSAAKNSPLMPMILGLLFLVVVGSAAAFYFVSQQVSIQRIAPTELPANTPLDPSVTIIPFEEESLCAVETKVCLDGTEVGVKEGSCEFEACPGEEAPVDETTTEQ